MSCLCRIRSGPVNAHLTPGPGIYFNAFIHVYSPRAGTDNPFGTESPYHFAHSLQVKKKSDFLHTFNDFIYVYRPGAWADNPLEETFAVYRKPLSLCPFVAGLKILL